IEVIDSGPGFDKDVDIHLRQQMDSILETGVLPSLKIEGMGILNIFIRLYLLDGITFLFDFGNNVEGGAFVKIGRSIDKSTDKS
ncbi:MAG: sensor histidine kinase, partial [Pseudobutyrivibrio sp.]|nr:sensor histidine kinase [Pseudobutyrivibrio sp.]